MSGIESLSAIQSKSTSVIIAEQLTERIVDGSFRPGEQINEAQVASQLNVSRGPVREALQRLVQEGLLISRPNRGVFVREFTAADVDEIYRAREVIEWAAAEIIAAGDQGARETIASGLASIVDRMAPFIATEDWGQVSRLDLAFHSRLVEASGNTRLHRAYMTLATESLICMSNVEQSYPYADPGDIDASHRELARLVGSGEMEEIHAALRQHLSMADDYLSTVVGSQLQHGRDVRDVV